MYVIYDTATTQIIKQCKTLAAAKGALTRMSNKYQARCGELINSRRTHRYADYEMTSDPQFIYSIAEYSDYSENIEQHVERVNLMTGETFSESVNVPHHCSPSSETYWCV